MRPTSLPWREQELSLIEKKRAFVPAFLDFSWNGIQVTFAMECKTPVFMCYQTLLGVPQKPRSAFSQGTIPLEPAHIFFACSSKHYNSLRLCKTFLNKALFLLSRSAQLFVRLSLMKTGTCARKKMANTGSAFSCLVSLFKACRSLRGSGFTFEVESRSRADTEMRRCVVCIDWNTNTVQRLSSWRLYQ